VRKILDILLIAAILTAVGVGAYEIGSRVSKESNELASHDADLNQKKTTPNTNGGPSRETVLVVAGAVGGAAGVIVLVSLGGSFRRSRRKQHWRAT
jgi:hypothetical protein